MINRRNTVYYELPESLVSGKRKDAKMEMSVNLTIPKELEKKGTKLIDRIMEEAAQEYKKFMRKQLEKLLDER